MLATSATVKPFFVRLSVISAVPFPAESCISVSLAAYGPEDDSFIILMADGRQKDGGLWETRSSGESKLLVQNGSTVCQAVHGICLYGDKVIICDRKGNILIEVDVSNGDVKSFVGKVNVNLQMDVLHSVVLHNHFLCVVKKKLCLLLTGQL